MFKDAAFFGSLDRQLRTLNNKELGTNVKDFIIGDGCDNQLEDNTYDIVYSNATIEHVGSHNKQKIFISECARVAKKTIFITTPNRYFPLDFHTKIPFIHMLPKITLLLKQAN